MHICRPPTISPALAEKSSGDISVFFRPRCFPRPNASMEKAGRFLSLFPSCIPPPFPACRMLQKDQSPAEEKRVGMEADFGLQRKRGKERGGLRCFDTQPWRRKRRRRQKNGMGTEEEKSGFTVLFSFSPSLFYSPLSSSSYSAAAARGRATKSAFPPPPPPLHKMHTRFLSSPSPSLHPRPFQLYCQGRGTEREGERDYKGTHTKRGRGEGSKIFTLSSPLLEKLRVVGVS